MVALAGLQVKRNISPSRELHFKLNETKDKFGSFSKMLIINIYFLSKHELEIPKSQYS